MTAPTVTILRGDARDKLREIPEESVHCVVTSPPYWGLRDYSRCGADYKNPAAHKEGETCGICKDGDGDGYLPADETYREDVDVSADWMPCPNLEYPHLKECPNCHGTGKDDSLNVVWDGEEGCAHEWGEEMPRQDKGRQHLEELGKRLGTGGGIKQSNPVLYERGPGGAFCLLCGAWRGQLGLEPTPDLYVRHIVAIFREVKRVLRDDGTSWINLGDCYAGGQQPFSKSSIVKAHSSERPGGFKIPSGLKPKDIVGMPWRVAFALQADGWWLRSDIVWSKCNPMPESVTDRPTKAHEYVFLMTKAARYFYDADAVREANSEFSERMARNDYLSDPCDQCGKAWVRQRGRAVTRKVAAQNPEGANAYRLDRMNALHQTEPLVKAGNAPQGARSLPRNVTEFVSDPTGPEETAEPACSCYVIPCTVLDPFAGSGTVGAVARSLSRSSVLIEIKEEYVGMIRDRTRARLQPLESFA